MRRIGALGCFILGYPKDMLQMSLVCPRVLSPECGTGLLRLEMLGICMLGGENAQPIRFKTDFWWWFRHGATDLTKLRRGFQNATGVRISTQTIRNQLHDAGLRSRRPAIRVLLTRYHAQMRLAWARDHVTWTQNDWAPVLFTDESRFCVDFTNRRARVWRMSVLLQFVWQNMIGLAGAQSWFGRK